MTTTHTDTNNLWMNQNGMICCEHHGGAGLAAAIASQPNSLRHVTDLDVWDFVTLRDMTALAKYGVKGCEVCRP
jgi:hypothetical protein